MPAGNKTSFMEEKQQEASLQALMDQTVQMVASFFNAECCRIFRLSYGCTGISENQLSVQEIGCMGQPEKLAKLPGGISVFIRSQGRTGMVITLHRAGMDEFAPEEVCFLIYILSLVLKFQEYTKIDTRLQGRILFLESLLKNVPGPAYFKDILPSIQSHGAEFTTGKSVNFLNKRTAGYSMHELEEVIPKELTAIYRRKNRGVSRAPGEFTGMMPENCIFRESEEALKIALEVQKVLWTVINNSPAIVFLWRNEDKWPADFVSENISQFGYEVEDFTSGRILYGDIVHEKDIKNVTEQLARCIEDKCDGFKMEYRIFTKGGELRWVDERTFIQRDEESRAIYLQGVVIDITERKLAEEALARAEQLRKKEINHRIKNNLQIVSSLLDLQAEKFSDKQVIEAFKESENRIVSMSLIHEELYESGNLDILDFSSYIRKLITDLSKSYSTESSDIRIHLDVDKVFLGVDTAVSLGIIINEFFTNSMKYAFSPGKGGKINITLFREGAGKNLEREFTGSEVYENFTLIFWDNGKGLPENFNFRNAESLGLKLVNALADQIDGSLDLDREKGTKFTIKFRDAVHRDYIINEHENG